MSDAKSMHSLIGQWPTNNIFVLVLASIPQFRHIQMTGSALNDTFNQVESTYQPRYVWEWM
jgi:hypothetical protein